MTTTQNFNLPYIVATQLQKEVTHAETLNIIDALLGMHIEDFITTLPSTAPINTGYITPDHIIHIYTTNGWIDITPPTAYRVYIHALAQNYTYDGSSWQAEDMVIPSVTALPTAGKAGRVLFNTTDNTVYVDTNSSWMAL